VHNFINTCVLKWHLSLYLKLKSRFVINLELSWVYLVAVVSPVAVVVSPLSCSVVSPLSFSIRTTLALTLVLSVLSVLPRSRSRSHVITDGRSVSQSVSMSRYRAHSETCDCYGNAVHSNWDLQIRTVAFVIDVRNMWEVSMEGSHTCYIIIYRYRVPTVTW
jgi:hypothetical protein